MVREGKVVRSRTDYILGTDQSLFFNVSFRYLRHNTDHYMVLGCLHSAPEREHAKYLTGRKKLPLRPPAEPTREDGIFATLRRSVPKPHARDRRMNEWISEDTWRLVDKRVSARRGTRVQARIRRLSREIAESLEEDRKRRLETAGKDVETLLGAESAKPEGVPETHNRVVQGCRQPYAAARSSYARADHGGAGRPLQLRAIHGSEHPGQSNSIEGGRLGTYGG